MSDRYIAEGYSMVEWMPEGLTRLGQLDCVTNVTMVTETQGDHLQCCIFANKVECSSPHSQFQQYKMQKHAILSYSISKLLSK